MGAAGLLPYLEHKKRNVPMKLSIITTMYRSAPFLEQFYERIIKVAEQNCGDFELIFVNDGSPDSSLQIALDLRNRDKRVCVVDLSRNFGHHAAIVAGLEHSRGEYVFLIDCDLEEQPEWLTLFLEHLKNSGAEVVFGVQKERVASFWSNSLGEMFWRALNVLSNVRIPHNPMTCRLMSRRYVNALLDVGDRVLYLAGVFAWTGFNQASLMLSKSPRTTTRSTYSLSRKFVQVADSFSSFSVAPLTLIFVLGLFIWLGSILFGTILLVHKLLHPNAILSGFTSLMLSFWFLSGTIILVLGVLGLYLSKIFQEVKRRPLYIVREYFHGGPID